MSVATALRVLVLVALAATAPAVKARAEGPTQSMSVWRIDGADAEVRTWLPVALARRFGATGEGDAPANAESFARAGLLTGDYLARRLVLETPSGRCEAVAGGPRHGAVDGRWIVHAWRVRCPDASGWRLRDDAFFEDAPSHAHFARVWSGGGEPIERVLTSGERVLAVGEPQVRSWRAAALERARRGAPLGIVLALAVLAGGAIASTPLRGPLAACAGLVLGGLASGASGAGTDGAALAILAVVVVPLAREGRRQALGAVLLVACGAIVALRGPAAAWLVALGVVLAAVAASRGRRRTVGIGEGLAGMITATTILAGESAPALAERAAAVALVAAPLVAVLVVAAPLARAPRWLPGGLAASVVAVTLAWIGLAAS